MTRKIGTLGFEIASFPACCGMVIACNFHNVTATKASTSRPLSEQWEQICREQGVNKLVATSIESNSTYNKKLIEGGWVQEGDAVENPNTGNMLILLTFTTSNIMYYNGPDDDDEDED